MSGSHVEPKRRLQWIEYNDRFELSGISPKITVRKFKVDDGSNEQAMCEAVSKAIEKGLIDKDETIWRPIWDYSEIHGRRR